jgi:hypothetical protein
MHNDRTLGVQWFVPPEEVEDEAYGDISSGGNLQLCDEKTLDRSCNALSQEPDRLDDDEDLCKPVRFTLVSDFVFCIWTEEQSCPVPHEFGIVFASEISPIDVSKSCFIFEYVSAHLEELGVNHGPLCRWRYGRVLTVSTNLQHRIAINSKELSRTSFTISK